jgi:hypothetical protein
VVLRRRRADDPPGRPALRGLRYRSGGEAVAAWNPVSGVAIVPGGPPAGIGVSANDGRMMVQQAPGYPTDVTCTPYKPQAVLDRRTSDGR